jgi:Ca2+-binding RTX toxin-like protein
MESIQVYYTPIPSLPFSYHKFIVYTDSDGNKWAIRGGPSGGPLNRGDIVVFGPAEYAPPVFDSSGHVVLSGFPDYDPNAHVETIETGSDLSGDWNNIVDAMNNIQSEDHPYNATTENSNTAVDEALQRAGLSSPTMDGFGDYWSPGSEDDSFRLLPGVPYIVPTNSASTIDDTPGTLPTLSPDQYYLFDPNTGNAYVVTNNSDPQYNGSLVISEPDNGNIVILNQGTYGELSYSNDTLTINLTNTSGDNEGILTIDTSTGTSVLSNQTDGQIVTFPPGGQVSIVSDRSDGGSDITYTVIPRGTWHGHINPFTGQIDNVTSSFITGGPFQDGGDLLLPNYLNPISSLFNRALIDPIVLDLSGANGGTTTGVQLTNIDNSSASFDLHGTGFAVHTGWVGPTTGILVSNSDPTSINNLFGNSSTDGFTALKALDTNNDGVLNSSDPGFASLNVWQDSNGNGVAESGEVQSLSSLGITSISLESSPVNETVNGNEIGEVATFTYSGGGTGQVAEAFFDNSTLQSQFSGSYTLNPATLVLPNLRGYGLLPDLNIAMSLDPTLLSMVQNLADETVADAAEVSQQVKAILYQWAGVENVDPTSRGPFINAQDLGVLEAITGESYTSFQGGGANPTNAQQTEFLEDAFSGFLSAVEERLLVQGPLASLFPNAGFNYDNDALTGTVDLSSVLTAAGAAAPTDTVSAAKYWANLVPFIQDVATDFGVSHSSYESALQSAIAASGLPAGNVLTLGNNQNDQLLDDRNSSTNDTLIAGTGANNTLLAGSGNDVVVVGDGNGNTLAYGGGVDTLISGDGNNTFAISNPFSFIAGTTIQSGTVFLGGTGNNVLRGDGDITNLSFSGIHTLLTNGITLTASQFNQFSTVQLLPNGGAQINAATGGTYDLRGKTTDGFNMIAQSSDGTTLISNDADNEGLKASVHGNDTLIGGNGNNVGLNAGTSSGNVTMIAGDGTGDNLTAGTGVDTMIGGNGGDTFITLQGLAAGSVIQGGTGTDTLEAEFDVSQATITGVENLLIDQHVVLTADQFNEFSSIDGFQNTGAIDTATGGTYSLVGKTTDSISMFAESNDGTTLNAGDLSNVQLHASSSGNDTLIAGNGSNVTLDAGGTVGNDTLSAGHGNNLVLRASTAGASTVTAGNGNNDQIFAGSGNDTITVGNGQGDTIQISTGVVNITAGNGDDTFVATSSGLAAGSSISAGTRANVIQLYGDMSQATITNVHTLQIERFGFAGLSAAEMSQFTSIQNQTLTGSAEIVAMTGGTFSLVGKTTDKISLGAQSNAGTTLIGNDAAGESLFASSSGNDTLIAGNGDNDTLDASENSANVTLTVGNGTGDALIAGSGIATMTAGTGDDTFIVRAGLAAGSVIQGGGGNDVLQSQGDISLATISGIQTLQTSNATLTLSQFNEFTAIQGRHSFFGDNIYVTTAGTYDLASKSADSISLHANSSGGTTLIGNNADGERLYASSSGNDTLQIGNGNNDQLYAGFGNDTLTAGNGDNDYLSTVGFGGGSSTITMTAGNGSGDTLDASNTSGTNMLTGGNGDNNILKAGSGTNTLTVGTGTGNMLHGGGGYDTYKFVSSFGQDSIQNNGGSAPNGEIDLASNMTDQTLWFQQSGNNLVITVLGTTHSITLNNWFSSNGAQVESINTASGYILDNDKVSDLVSTMATYAAANSGFDPTTATSMPSDATLQSAIATAWITPIKEWGGASGDWANSTAWVGGVVPSATADAELGGSATYTATVSASNTIHDLTISDASATLSDTGSLMVNGALVNDGAITVDGGTLTAGDVTGTGSMTINSGTVELGGADNGTVTFGGAGTLKLDQPQSFSGTIAGLVPTDTLDLGGISATGASIGGNTLTVNETGGSTLTLNMTGIPTGATVQVASDGHGGSDLTFAPPENGVALTGDDDTVTGLTGNRNVFTTTVDDLTSGDVVQGATFDAWTSNSLVLQGGGYFHLETPATLANIDAVDAQEGSDGNGDYQIVILRDGLNTTVNVADGSDPSTDGISIVGADNVSTINLGTGQDVFIEAYDNAGTVVNGAGANSTLVAQTDDISQITLNGVGTLDVSGPSSLTLTANQLAEFSTINADGGSLDLIAAGAGTYDLTGKTVTPYIGLDARQTNDNVTLKAGSTDAVLFSGGGVDTLIGGSGNDLFYLDYGTGAGSTFTGGTGTNTLNDAYVTDISNLNITGMQVLQTFVGSLTLTADQLAQFSTIDNEGGPLDVVAAGAGTYDLTGKTLTDEVYLDARSTLDNVTLKAGSGDAVLLSGAGVDTLIGGSGDNLFYLTYGTAAGTTFTGGSGTNTFEDDYTNDISNLNISGIDTLKTFVGFLTLTADQLAGFSTIEADGGALDIVAAGAGTYDLTGKTLTDAVYLDARQTNDNVTLKAGADDTILLSGGGVDTLIGGSGNDTFYLTYGSAAGSTFTGGSGTNTFNDAYTSDISNLNITGMQILDTTVGSLTLTADQLSQFSTINPNAGPLDIVAAGAGTYDLTGKTLNGEVDLDASATTDNVTMIAGSADANLIAGAGVDTLIGGAGNDTFYTGYDTAAGSTFTGGTGTNTLVAQVGDISVMNITGMDTLDAYGLGSVTLTADQLAEFGTINTGGTTGLVAAGAGTYDLTGKTLDSVMTLDASQTSADVTLIGSDQDGQTLVGGAGTDTLVAGTGTNVTLYGGSGATTYEFGSSFGQDTINNDGANSTPANQINFGSGITDENLWLQLSGNDLQIGLLGTNQSVTVAGWDSDAGSQVQSINAGGDTLVYSQVQQLVQAMATYQSNNSAFNPTTATAMPTDSTLQAAIAANWQHS